MKHKLLFLLLVMAVLIFAFTACGKKNETEDGSAETQTAEAEDEAEDGYDDDELVDVAPEDRLNIGISLPSETQYNKKLAKELTNRLWRKGFNVILKYAENDVSTQQTQISDLLTQDIKCLIVYPAAQSGLDLTEVSSAKIPIINIDLPLYAPAPIDLYVGYDNVKAGELAADYVISLKKLSGNKDVTIEMLFGESDPISADIYTGVMNKLSQYFDNGALVCRSGRTTLEACSTTSENAVAVYNDLGRILSGYYLDCDLEILITGADYIASGAAAYFLTNGYAADSLPMITGINGEPSAAREFEQGFISMTSFKDAREEAKICTRATLSLIEGKYVSYLSDETIYNGSKDVPSVILEPKILTAENYIETLINSGYYTDEEIYG